MAEALGLAASVFAAIQIADRVIVLCKHYIEAVQDAPSDLRSILIETSTLKIILENVNFLIRQNGQSSVLISLDSEVGPIKGCETAMSDLEKLFPADGAQVTAKGKSKKRKLQDSLTTLAWPLKQNKAKKLLQDIATHKNTITLALTSDTVHVVQEIKQTTTQIQAILTDSQRYEVFAWLWDTDPSTLHHRACSNYEPGTCDWVERLPTWAEFLEGTKRCLWIHGIPGAGKTVLASQLIERIERHCETGPRKLFSVYYYCYFGHNQDESIPFLKWILNRLCREAEMVPDYLWKLFKHGGQPSLKDLLRVLQCALQWSDRVYITIDAIDESDPRQDLLSVLRDLATDPRFAKIQLLVTSREYLDIERALQDISVDVSMKNSFLDADIRLYARSRLRKTENIKRWPADLEEEALEALTDGAHGMFRWVVCQIDMLRRIKGTSAAIQLELKRLPRTLYDTYDRIFEQIPEEDRHILNIALRWLYFNVKVVHGLTSPSREIPNLTFNALAGAVSAEISTGELHQKNYLHDIGYLRELCGCLITESHELCACDSPHPTVAFAHYTVIEYLSSPHRELRDPFFLLDQHQLVLEQAKKVFHGAATLKENDREEESACQHTPDYGPYLVTFGGYCCWMAMWLICYFDVSLAERDDLLHLASEYLILESGPLQMSSEGHALFLLDEYHSLLKLDWVTLPDTKVRFVINLLCFGSTKMAQKVIKNTESKILQAHVEFKCGPREMQWSFQGSVIESFAFIGTRLRFDLPFKTLLQCEGFSIRRLLLFWTMFHSQSQFYCCDPECTQRCILQKLCDLRADAAAEGSDERVTPLQIAVAVKDPQAVRVLLEAGADPNGIGCPDVAEWPQTNSMSCFNKLSGRTPMQICDSKPGPFLVRLQNYLGTHLENEQEIRDILIQYGASSDRYGPEYVDRDRPEST